MRAGNEIALGGPKQRAVLALLLLDAGRVVPAGRLVEELWRGQAPPGAATTLRSYVSRLRALLGPEAEIVSRGGGYAIRVAPEQVDVGRFERLVAAGQQAWGQGEAAAAGNRFREALRLWRGTALADVCEVESLALEGARLEELRLAVVEGRVEADIELGRHAEVTGELERLVAEYPLRERLWRLLVLALYRGERQADALAAYQRARTMLAAELGLEPGQELRRLEEAVLRQDVAGVAPPARHNLPAPFTSFVGREQDLARLRRLLGEARLITVTGTGGAGKTRLAVEAAARVVGRFPDGVWLAELAGIADPGQAAGLVAEALGMRQDGDVPLIEALRYRLRSAELLLVLDNCEHLLDACAELAGALRGAAGLRVLTTSREPLGIPGEVTYPLRPLAVPPDPAGGEALVDAPSVRLFVDRGSAARGGRADLGVVAVAGRICRKLDGLPLAIELAAARMSTLSAAEIEAHLTDSFRFLAYRRPVADPRHQALQATMDWSYELLSAEERAALGELSVFAGSFGLEQVAAVCSSGDQAAALEVIDRLASKSLVTTEPGQGGTRYRLLETIRQYAAGRLAEAGSAETARQRHAHAFLDLAQRERSVAVLSRDHGNFRAALGWSLPAGDQAGPRLAHALGDFWLACGLLQEGRDWLERALAQRSADQRTPAYLLRLLGTILYELGDLSRAEVVLTEGSHVSAAAGAAAEQARIRVLLTDIHAQQGGGYAEAREECEAAAAVLESEGDLEGLAEAWLCAGKLRFFHGEWPADEQALERAAAYGRQSGNHRAEMQASGWLVAILLRLPVPVDAAIRRVERLLQAASGELWAEADILMTSSLLYAYAGRFADARAASARGRSAFTRFGAKIAWAIGAIPAGETELVAGDPAAAERHLKEGYEVLRAMGERGYLCGVTGALAEALYAQGRLDEAQRMTEETEVAASPDDIEGQVQWRVTRAKLLARRGEFAAARQLVGEAEALTFPTSWAVLQAQILMAKAEVHRLSGAPDEAADNLRAALRIYEDRHAVPLAVQVRAALASLTAHPGREPM